MFTPLMRALGEFVPEPDSRSTAVLWGILMLDEIVWLLSEGIGRPALRGRDLDGTLADCDLDLGLPPAASGAALGLLAVVLPTTALTYIR